MNEKSKMGRKIWEFFDDVKLFFREAKSRWNAETPKFFRILGRACTWFGGLGFVATAMAKFNWIFPPAWVENLTTVITFAGAMGALVSGMTFSSGQKIDLQYTEKKQEEKALKEISEHQ